MNTQEKIYHDTESGQDSRIIKARRKFRRGGLRGLVILEGIQQLLYDFRVRRQNFAIF